MRSLIQWLGSVFLSCSVMGSAVAANEPAAAAAKPAQSVTAEQRAVMDKKAQQKVNQLDKPLYTPFIERYVLDDLKSLRTEMLNLRAEMTEKVTHREMTVADRTMTYATDTVTYFFYLIAGASSLLVLVGWNSIREIKDRVHTQAREQVTQLVQQYEERLREIEVQLQDKTKAIDENAEQIELTNEIHSLWLRASQDSNPASRIDVYDRILDLRPYDVEALTYKADAVLEMGEPRWAISLCRQALARDSDNSHAFYQLACAYAACGQEELALSYLTRAVDAHPAYIDSAIEDEALDSLRETTGYAELEQRVRDTRDENS